jgi:hypothetical protein
MEQNNIDGYKIPMVCEYGDCREPGKEYEQKYKWLRRLLRDEWVNEPVHLCDKHSKGYKPIKEEEDGNSN